MNIQFLPPDQAAYFYSAKIPNNHEYLSKKHSKEKPDDPLGGLFFSPSTRHYSTTNPHSSHIAGIKLAMQHFGQSPADIFKEVTPLNAGFNITMRDGFKLFISHKELQLSKEGCQMLGDGEVLKDATFLYAALVKRKQLESRNPAENANFSLAMRNTNEGEHASTILKLLGLKEHIKAVRSDELAAHGGMGISVASSRESVFVVGGAEDFHGTPSRIRKKKLAYVLI
ncbi:hypothetical protein [Pseudomonas fildesensis]|uniref:hypothetical protein n=1 Tax=Pseudomonas fildesensis TaxID=1674920 RepID=UPI00065F8DB0|nr:hypothetical protein [Pseudomonas fildesensis]